MCIIYFLRGPGFLETFGREKQRAAAAERSITQKLERRQSVPISKKCPNTLSVALFSALISAPISALISHHLVKGNTTVKLKAALAFTR